METVCPRSRREEWSGFERILAGLPGDASLLHYGVNLRSWLEDTVCGSGLRDRLVDVSRALRGAAVYPGPVFGLSDHVRHGLGRDPHREGHADAAALRAGGPEGEAWLVHKGSSDLRDLAALVEKLSDGGRAALS